MTFRKRPKRYVGPCGQIKPVIVARCICIVMLCCSSVLWILLYSNPCPRHGQILPGQPPVVLRFFNFHVCFWYYSEHIRLDIHWQNCNSSSTFISTRMLASPQLCRAKFSSVCEMGISICTHSHITRQKHNTIVL